MIKRYLTLTLTAAAILAAPTAFAASGQAKTAAKVTKQAAARQAFAAAPVATTTNSAESVAVARPPAQPGAW
ncbi:hypothetical protein [Bradyrhizobium sp.]|uniref:hypothetical protein n=1 Tax=Bradyrhizobium sp. TaxID=376 RepID=UPI002DDCB6F7|nr:hypothetical protein [Bradyrhizobium sp.]HEV2157548.1 hypothetical protein [Bradyrhizobium sp.]